LSQCPERTGAGALPARRAPPASRRRCSRRRAPPERGGEPREPLPARSPARGERSGYDADRQTATYTFGLSGVATSVRAGTHKVQIGFRSTPFGGNPAAISGQLEEHVVAIAFG
jgi:hypothetical protein